MPRCRGGFPPFTTGEKSQCWRKYVAGLGRSAMGPANQPLMQQRRRPGRKPLVNHSALYPYSRFRRERRSMPHSIEVWRAVISTARSLLLLAKGIAGEPVQLSVGEHTLVAQRQLQYPGT